MTIRPRVRKKLSKHIVTVLSVAVIGGLVVAFVSKYGTVAGRPTGPNAQKIAATVAAQVGNDTPESKMMAQTEISQADQHIQQQLAIQVQQKQAEHAYPQDKMPFELGGITPEQLSRYQSAKNALSASLRHWEMESTVSSLPNNFDDSGSMSSEQTRQTTGPVKDTGKHKMGELVSQTSMPAHHQLEDSPMDQAQQTGNVISDNVPLNTQTSAASINPVADSSSNQLIQSMLNRSMSPAKIDANATWQTQQEKLAQHTTIPIKVGFPPTVRMLQEGAVIPLVLMTALNNTLPGHVSARVTSNVYDSITGDVLMIPAGSKLEGSYNASTSFGQNRMMFGFSRIILPSGASIQIAAWNGGDAQGRAGVAGELDNHLWQQFGTGVLLATLGWALQPPNSPNGVIVNTAGGNYSLDSAAGQVTANTASGILANYQNMKPELNVAAGTKLALIVLQDIELPTAKSLVQGAI